MGLFVVVMGVSGSGKTTVGRLLAERLGRPFYDGDDYHSPANVAKMAAGIPLTDADRAAWLATLAALIRDGLARGESGVVACSALRRSYREALRVDAARVRFVYLRGDHDVIRARLAARRDHFMSPDLLRSQFEALEEPVDALTFDVALPPERIIEHILAALPTEDSRPARS